MLEAFAGVIVQAAKPRSSHAAIDAVKGAGLGRVNELAARLGHGRSLSAPRLRWYLKWGQIYLRGGCPRVSRCRASLNDLLNRLSDLLSDIPKVLPNAGAFARLKGALASPLSGSAAKLSNFGVLTENGRAATGIVLAAPLGSEVRAVAGGRVAFSDWLRGFGLLIIIDHGDGYLSLYGQCESVLKTEGDWIDAGTVIATSGQIKALGPGLYFELRQRGRPVDPGAWFRR